MYSLDENVNETTVKSSSQLCARLQEMGSSISASPQSKKLSKALMVFFPSAPFKARLIDFGVLL